MTTQLSMRDLLEAGVHFGHQTGRWNPKMAPFIYGARNGVHILDLAQTVGRLNDATDFVRDTVADGQRVLFVGTKRQAQDVIRNEADRAGMPHVVTRWLGGTLTNFATIRSRVDYMIELERREEIGQLDLLPKKEALRLRDKLTRLHRYLIGLRDMTVLPGAVFIVDVPREHIAVAEAKRLHIPIVAVCDTNCDPPRHRLPDPLQRRRDPRRAPALVPNRRCRRRRRPAPPERPPRRTVRGRPIPSDRQRLAIRHR